MHASNTSCYPLQCIIKFYLVVLQYHIWQTGGISALFKNKRIAFGWSRPDRSIESQLTIFQLVGFFLFLVFVIILQKAGFSVSVRILIHKFQVTTTIRSGSFSKSRGPAFCSGGSLPPQDNGSLGEKKSFPYLVMAVT